jgi:MFS transporter, ACS family, hexuronate transporter
VLEIYFRWGWRPAFMVPGILGFLWLIAWRRLYFPPEEHSRISPAELEMIVADKRESTALDQQGARPRWSDLLKLPQTWGVIIAKASTDPVFFFITEWFPVYLVAKGIELRTGLIAVWIPFIAADLGSFFAGGASGYLIKRGWSLGAARKALIVFGGVGMTMLIPTIFTTNLYLIAFLFAVATFTYAGFTTMANVLPSDLFHSESVASVSGFSGTGAGIGTIVAFKLIGYFSDARQATGTHSFDPIVIIAGLVPFAGMILVLLLVRNTQATNEGLVRQI